MKLKSNQLLADNIREILNEEKTILKSLFDINCRNETISRIKYLEKELNKMKNQN